MDNEEKEILDAEVQDDNASAGVDNSDTLKEGENPSDERYLNQRKRAEKAEERVKALENELNKKSPETQNQITNSQELSRDEVVLLAQGMTEEEVSKLHSVAKAEGVSLREAKDSDLFTAWYDKKQREKKSEMAKLSGGGSAKTQAVKMSGLSESEHKDLWKKRLGQ